MGDLGWSSTLATGFLVVFVVVVVVVLRVLGVLGVLGVHIDVCWNRAGVCWKVGRHQYRDSLLADPLGLLDQCWTSVGPVLNQCWTSVGPVLVGGAAYAAIVASDI